LGYKRNPEADMSNRACVASTLALTAIPAAAAAAPLTPVGVVAAASPLSKLIILGLLVSAVAAVVVCVRKLASGPRLAGGSAFLSGLRLGGPLAGLLGAAWTGLGMAIGVANVVQPVPASLLARGVAEVMMLITLGLLAGAAGVIGAWAVEARIDRAVLRE
jgi:hypothetical protein